MDQEIRRITNRHAAFAAVISFLAQPIPGADELIVIPVHYWLARKVTRKRGVSLMKVPWRPVNKIIWAGAGARLVANFTLGLVPIAGAFSNAATAIALTEYLSRYLNTALDHPDRPPPEISMDDVRKAIRSAFTEAWKT